MTSGKLKSEQTKQSPSVDSQPHLFKPQEFSSDSDALLTESTKSATTGQKPTKFNMKNRAKKQAAIAHKGGACEHCGYTSEYTTVFDFHHKDPETKSEEINVMIGNGLSLKRILPEVDKCLLLCAICHRIVHEKEML